MLGINITDIDSLDDTVVALKELRNIAPITARIVIDNGRPLLDYRDAALKLQPYAALMVQIQDSYSEAKVTTSALYDKADRLWKILGDLAAVWEIGNEINGAWLSRNVVQRTSFLSDYFSARNQKRAITVFAQKGYLAWIRQNRIPCDYLLVSSYPENNRGLLYNWENDFLELSKIYPTSLVGFGEFGTESWQGADTSTKRHLIQYYYGMALKNPSFIGGGYYWDFQEICDPKNSQLLDVMKETVIRNMHTFHY